MLIGTFICFNVDMIFVSDQAILITGGYNGSSYYLTTAELYYKNGTKLCLLPDLPSGRSGHSQYGVITCGGYVSTEAYNCVTLRKGEWVPSHHLRHKRAYHVTWTRDNEIILIGGDYSQTTSEILRTDSSVTSSGFSLKYKTW